MARLPARFAQARPVPPVFPLVRQVRISCLLDGAAVSVEHAWILTGAREFAHAVVEFLRIARFQLADRSDSQFLEILQHFLADSAKIFQPPLVL